MSQYIPSESESQKAAEQNYFPSSQDVGGELYDTDNITKKFSRKSTNNITSVDDPNSKDHNVRQIKHSATETLAPHKSNEPTEKVGITHPFIRSFIPLLAYKFIKIQVLLACLIIGAFSLYWGALYDRPAHLVGLKMLVVNQDYYPDGIGSTVLDIIEQDYQKKGTWTVLNSAEEIQDFFKIDDVNNHNISELVLTEVHHRHYWSGTYIFPNATENQIQYYQNNQVNDTTPSVKFMYETGRDITSVTPYVVDTLQDIEGDFIQRFYQGMAANLTQSLTIQQKAEMVQSGTAFNLPYFFYLDYRPYDNNVLLAPLQVGLIYLIISSFFLVNFFNDVHGILIPYLRPGWYLLYRIAFNHINFLFVSIFICSVSAIYQVDFTRAFGKGGFCVYWMTTYLTLAAVGGANENMALLIFAFDPKLLSFWLISFVILNVSPSFSPMALTNVFYRYGYSMPIHHSNEIYKVIFMNLWKGQLGLNFGVLCAWIVLNTLLLPFILVIVARQMAKKQRISHEKNMDECRKKIEEEQKLQTTDV
ncbi:hypothetical protein WICPIJ_009397 [Wickerhamomyces pijperi]|uniref:DUF3533 domain-containing protein n=1 Tax=Wickerhamomyces pijperi TaxID=599730 RepID=A0A9P8PNY0_WICPI|nr:hypothetical protein WICPIJ_009397 [Wickerhamomyces pijperi]